MRISVHLGQTSLVLLVQALNTTFVLQIPERGPQGLPAHRAPAAQRWPPVADAAGRQRDGLSAAYRACIRSGLRNDLNFYQLLSACLVNI